MNSSDLWDGNALATSSALLEARWLRRPSVFQKGLKEAGFYRGPERLANIAGRKASTIGCQHLLRTRSTSGGCHYRRRRHSSALAAKAATGTIPIIFELSPTLALWHQSPRRKPHRRDEPEHRNGPETV
jgi:hypothetical protein